MKWKEKRNQKPRMGDKKSVLKFAWWPVTGVKCQDGNFYTVWLDKYHAEYEYREYVYMEDGRSSCWEIVGKWASL